MNKVLLRLFSLLLVIVMVAAVFTACGQNETPVTEGPTQPAQPEHIDYAGTVVLDMAGPTKKQEVTWGERSHIDGDTSHFEVPYSVDQSGVIKARYLAVDTPESTGQIEEWGKAASRFTKEKLSKAHSIIVESESETWNFDGNGRYLLWIWYQELPGDPYRNLNLELLQSGLGGGSDSSKGLYGEQAVAAINQATQEKLYMFSGEKDPEFPYGEAQSVTLRELRTNAAQYEGSKVAVEGIISFNSDYTAYIESYDAETDMNYGMQVFYGYNSQLIPVLEQGAQVRIVGVVNSFYGTYQISSLTYNRMKPEDPANTSQVSKGNAVPYTKITPSQFYSNVTVTAGEEEQTIPYHNMIVATSVAMDNLYVKSIYTTNNPSSDDNGAMTLTCTVDGVTMSIRTEVLKDADGNIITKDAYMGKTINVKGIVDQYNGKYQIRVFSPDDITIVG